VANMIKGKSPEEIRKLFNIQNESVPLSPYVIVADIQFLIRGGGADPKRERVGRGVGPLLRTDGVAANHVADKFKLHLRLDHVVTRSRVYILNNNRRMIMHVR